MTSARSEELTADWLTLDTADGPMRVYLVRPRSVSAVTPSAAVIVLQEAFGVNEHIQDIARRVAAQGYVAAAPDLFHRSGVNTVQYTDRETAMSLIGELGAEQLVSDVDTVLSHLSDVEHIAANRTAIVGFCFGGRAAFSAATALPLAASVVFYGPGIVNGPHAVLDRIAGITGPVLMFVGDADPTIPADDVAAIRAAAKHAGIDLRVVVFSGAGHAFHCDARPAQYVEDAARKAWRSTSELLAKTFTKEAR